MADSCAESVHFVAGKTRGGNFDRIFLRKNQNFTCFFVMRSKFNCNCEIKLYDFRVIGFCKFNPQHRVWCKHDVVYNKVNQVDQVNFGYR